MRTLTALVLILSATFSNAADVVAHRDLAYATPSHQQQKLDVYHPASGHRHPVMIWIHGGGWRIGDKRAVQEKPTAFINEGFVFVSINYRFVPEVTIPKMAQDVAKAIAWTHEHADEYRGDADQLFVGGHSAGAHLAALVCTDKRYLEAESLTLKNIKGCIPVDTAAYNVAKLIRDQGRFRSRTYTRAFGDDVASQKRFSPITHVEQGKHIPPFLILHVASRDDSSAQSQEFANTLQKAGGTAKVVAVQNKTHASINRELGLPDDMPTKAVFKFLARLTK